VLAAECKEIKADLQQLKTLTSKYGPHWELAVKRLKDLKASKLRLVQVPGKRRSVLLIGEFTADQRNQVSDGPVWYAPYTGTTTL
jgi:hypothetical protein